MRAHSLALVLARAATLACFALLALPGGGCGIEPLRVIGDQCERNSDCDDPLVCGLGRCRRACEASRDCALGLRCLKLASGLGVCQLPSERSCERNTDCEEPLACFPGAGCDLACVANVDCAAGASCEGGQCREPEVTLCVYSSDCSYPLVCGSRQTCREECSTSFDCPRGEACVQDPACSGPCMCRPPCAPDADVCPAGSECTPCGAGLDCSGVEAYCERPDPDGVIGG
jgi:hypothetical protein